MRVYFHDSGPVVLILVRAPPARWGIGTKVNPHGVTGNGGRQRLLVNGLQLHQLSSQNSEAYFTVKSDRLKFFSYPVYILPPR